MTANLGDMGIYFWQKPKVAKTFIWLHFVRILFCLDSWQSHDNRSNGGVAFVFVENFGIKLDLESVDSQNFLQVRNCIPQNKLKKRKLPPKLTPLIHSHLLLSHLTLLLSLTYFPHFPHTPPLSSFC